MKDCLNSDQGLLDAVISIQNNSYAKILNSEKSIFYLNKKDKRLEDLLKLIVGDERYYEQYLFDQQYSHPGLSGLVCAIELKPDALFSERNITLFDIIYLELLFELESLEVFVSKNFKPLATGAVFEPTDLFEDVLTDDYWEGFRIVARIF